MCGITGDVGLITLLQPYIPAAHPQLPVYIVAEKAADSISRQYAT